MIGQALQVECYNAKDYTEYNFTMPDFNRNNLAGSSSPYLKQHKENPVYWQQWNKKTLDFAKNNQKLIFVSIGYATCHWCHVMASEAFSDQKTADYLNKYFVSIKVDREQRPDVDEYFMGFVTSTLGQGGWPLNVFLSPDAIPIFGGTYFPHIPKRGILPLTQVLEKVRKWYADNKDSLQKFSLTRRDSVVKKVEEDELEKDMKGAFDNEYGGFGVHTKFPPHNTLLFLLNYYQESKSKLAGQMVIKTLDAMANNGLHDHLQGGFFRYSVDRRWSIPHFEKMLYDQAMLLWVYSTSFQLFKRHRDKSVAEMVVKCLTETFSDGNGLFYSAHDADTDHKEGSTYIWRENELKGVLERDEFEQFSEVYKITKEGNFEGRNHLLKKDASSRIAKIEAKLLAIRKRRAQPFVDKKIVTSWNALVGIGLLIASRYLGKSQYKSMAFKVFDEIVKRHWVEDRLAHSSLGANLQSQEFLEDYAAMLVLATYLYEENPDNKKGEKFKSRVKKFLSGISKFKRGDKWFGNVATDDFGQIPANTYDHPGPSAVSLAELGTFRGHKILAKDDIDLPYKAVLQNDFHNLVAYYAKGRFHEIHAPERLAWNKLPVNSLFIKHEKYQDCTAFTCNEFESKSALINSFT